MQNIFKSKYSLGLSFLIVIILFIYLFKTNNPYTTPTDTFTPENYPAGTTVELWENIPPEFPTGLILENKKIEHADVVSTAEGKTQMTVSYFSEKGMIELADMYKASLIAGGWKIEGNYASEKAATMLATKEAESLVVTIAPKESITTVTFLYNK
jgi:hypothetical protein